MRTIYFFCLLFAPIASLFAQSAATLQPADYWNTTVDHLDGINEALAEYNIATVHTPRQVILVAKAKAVAEAVANAKTNIRQLDMQNPVYRETSKALEQFLNERESQLDVANWIAELESSKDDDWRSVLQRLRTEQRQAGVLARTQKKLDAIQTGFAAKYAIRLIATAARRDSVHEAMRTAFAYHRAIVLSEVEVYGYLSDYMDCTDRERIDSTIIAYKAMCATLPRARQRLVALGAYNTDTTLLNMLHTCLALTDNFAQKQFVMQMAAQTKLTAPTARQADVDSFNAVVDDINERLLPTWAAFFTAKAAFLKQYIPTKLD